MRKRRGGNPPPFRTVRERNGNTGPPPERTASYQARADSTKRPLISVECVTWPDNPDGIRVSDDGRSVVSRSTRLGALRWADATLYFAPAAPSVSVHGSTDECQVSTGSVFVFNDVAFRFAVEGVAPTTSLLDEAEEFVSELSRGWLRVEVVDGFRLAWFRWGASPARLADFARTALARSLKSLHLVVAPRGADALNDAVLEPLAEALGALANRTRFVVPRPDDVSAFATLEVPPAWVTLNDALLDLSAPVYLSPDGPTSVASAAPSLRSWGKGALLTRPGEPSVVLLPGDVWGALRVHAERPQLPFASLRPTAIPSLVVKGQPRTSLYFYGREEELVLQQGPDGLFADNRGSRALPVQGAKLRWLGREQDADFSVGLTTWLHGHDRLVLVEPSPFLMRGLSWPALSTGALEVFIDQLLEAGDGAADALRALGDARGSPSQDDCFNALMMTSWRGALGRWLASERNALSTFASTQFVGAREEKWVRQAIAVEPVFGFIRELKRRE